MYILIRMSRVPVPLQITVCLKSFLKWDRTAIMADVDADLLADSDQRNHPKLAAVSHLTK
jgi:hypothetical protein